MRVSIECLKKQLRQKNWSKSQWSIRIKGNTTRSQWQFKERAASSAGKHNWQGVTIGSSFVSDWLQKWPQFSWPITALARQKRFLIGSDTCTSGISFASLYCSLCILLKLPFNGTPSLPSSSTIFLLFYLLNISSLPLLHLTIFIFRNG